MHLVKSVDQPIGALLADLKRRGLLDDTLVIWGGELHATLLHLMDIDHEKLTYRFNGRDFRLTDVAGNVIRDVLT